MEWKDAVGFWWVAPCFTRWFGDLGVGPVDMMNCILDQASPSTSNGLFSCSTSCSCPWYSSTFTPLSNANPPSLPRLEIRMPGCSSCVAANSTTLSELTIALGISRPRSFRATPLLVWSSTSSFNHGTCAQRPTSRFVVSSTAPKWFPTLPLLVMIASKRSNSSRL